jgi:hypothetical protein
MAQHGALAATGSAASGGGVWAAAAALHYNQHIKGMPEAPWALLKRLVDLLKALVGQLRELCLQV